MDGFWITGELPPDEKYNYQKSFKTTPTNGWATVKGTAPADACIIFSASAKMAYGVSGVSSVEIFLNQKRISGVNSSSAGTALTVPLAVKAGDTIDGRINATPCDGFFNVLSDCEIEWSFALTAAEPERGI